MGMILSEEQQLLRNTARAWIADKAPITHFRHLRDNDETFCADNWAAMVEQGWPGICIPEAFGGLGFGVQGMGLLLQEMGRTLTVSPLLSSCLLCSHLIEHTGTNEHATALLKDIASGEQQVALAIDEQAHHNPTAIETAATANNDGYVINGQKTFVMDGSLAGQLLVVARTSGAPGDSNGLSLLLVDAQADGLTVEPLHTMDSRDWTNISFNAVRTETLLGSEGEAWEVLDRGLDLARIGLSAEMLGACEELFERTVTYLKERQQFDVPIGSFQALKHRASQMFCELELLQSVVLQALTAADAQSDDLAVLASLAKAKAGETIRLISNEAIQMHGGIGVTDELDLGLFLKRGRITEQVFGGQQFHRERYARLCGF